MNKLGFDDFIGNDDSIKFLKLLIKQAENDKFARVPDMAFLGASGLGKTFCSKIVASHLNREFVEINSTVVTDPFQFRGYITNPTLTSSGAIILLDECHNLKKKIQDNLLTALQHPRKLHTEYKQQIFVDSITENISFIFSTTHAGMISTPLLSRLRRVEFLDYSQKEFQKMAIKYLLREHKFDSSKIEPPAIVQLAKRARNGRSLVEHCDDAVRLMKAKNKSKLSVDIVEAIFSIKGIDAYGLTRIDRKLLGYLAESRTYIGLETLEAALNISKKEIKDTVEPWLLRNRFIARHASGRIVTNRGYNIISGGV